MTFIMAAVLLAGSCGEPAANNAGNGANKPANALNNAATAPVNKAAVETEIKGIMSEMASELAKNDADAVAKHYADDYHLVTPQGVDQPKAVRLADMKSGNSKFESFAYENISVRTYGDTAVAIADVKAKGTTAGQPVSANIKATLVFHKTKDGWKVVSGQATPVTAAPAKPDDAKKDHDKKDDDKPAPPPPANK